MTEVEFRRRVLVELARVATALEAHNAADPLAMIQRAFGEGVVAPEAPERLQPASWQAPGALAVYRHPAGDGWRIVAKRDGAEPSGWTVFEERHPEGPRG